MAEDIIRQQQRATIMDEVPSDFITEGEKLLAAYKGITLYGISGQSTDEQSLSRGHFGGRAAGIMSLFIYLQELLNDFATLKPDLIPVMKKTPKGKVWVTDAREATLLGHKHGYKIVQKGEWIIKPNDQKEFIVHEDEKEKFFYDYKGFTTRDTDIAMFAYNVARATARTRPDQRS